MDREARLQSMGSQRVGHNWVTKYSIAHWRSLFKWLHPLHHQHLANGLHSHFPYFSEKIAYNQKRTQTPNTSAWVTTHLYLSFWVLDPNLPPRYSRTLLLQLCHSVGITDCPLSFLQHANMLWVLNQSVNNDLQWNYILLHHPTFLGHRKNSQKSCMQIVTSFLYILLHYNCLSRSPMSCSLLLVNS